MNLATRVGAVSAAVILSTVLAACGSTAAPAASSSSTTAAQASGSSAEPTSSMPSAMSSVTSSVMGMPMASAPAGPHNQADIAFAQQMIIHHRGAIEMADLAPSRGGSMQVKDLAAKIKAAQQPEIAEMSGWLASWAPDTDMNGKPNRPAASSSQMGGMGSMPGTSTSESMPGMMSGSQMDQLRAATGTAFDKMFLQLMIGHHQGALDMARTESASGSSPEALALALAITTSQTEEITTMQGLLKGM